MASSHTTYVLGVETNSNSYFFAQQICCTSFCHSAHFVASQSSLTHKSHLKARVQLRSKFSVNNLSVHTPRVLGSQINLIGLSRRSFILAATSPLSYYYSKDVLWPYWHSVKNPTLTFPHSSFPHLASSISSSKIAHIIPKIWNISVLRLSSSVNWSHTNKISERVFSLDASSLSWYAWSISSIQLLGSSFLVTFAVLCT